MAPPRRIEVPIPLPLRTANAWLFPGGEAPALVDCGIGTPEGYAALRAGLQSSNVDMARLRIYATHGHPDHVGNAARLRRELGAVLCTHPAEVELVERFRSGAVERYAHLEAALRLHGVPAGTVARMRERGEWFDNLTEDAPVAETVPDGARVMLGDTEARAHLAPGHTAGSLVFATEGNELLTGDTLLHHVTSNAVELTDADKGRYAQYLRTLDGLRRFIGMRALPGHHAPFELREAVLDEHFGRHRARSQTILANLDAPRTAWDLVPRVFPRLAHAQAFLGVCEVVGHLHALELDGRAASSDRDGVRRFTRA